jgi:hypothetical protein
MTREQHIKAAERLLREYYWAGNDHPTERDIALAQVHATLALTAPSGDVVVEEPVPVPEPAQSRRRWWSR